MDFSVTVAVFFVSFGHSKSFVLLTQAKRRPSPYAVTVVTNFWLSTGIILVVIDTELNRCKDRDQYERGNGR